MALIKNESLTKSKIIKKRSFPTREDYERYFNNSNIWLQEETVQLIHKHWHGRGQNGCLFAQHLAKESENRTGWYLKVFFQDKYDVSKLDKIIEQAIEDPKIEVLSLLFPEVVTLEQLAKLVRSWMTESKIIFLERATRYKNRICLALRIELGQTKISSWLMMFAPFEFFPNTRQSPITELAIRVKPKPENVYSKLSQDREVAHLADTPFYLPESIVDSTWDATFRNTEYLLGYKPDLIAAAKTTISFEMNNWSEFFGDLNIKFSDFLIKEEQYS